MKHILSRIAIIGLVMPLQFILSGCSRDSTGPLPHSVLPDEASIQIEKIFAGSTDPWAQENAKAEITALKNHQYDVAYGTLQGMIASGRLTLAEDMAVRNAILGLNEALIRAKAAGESSGTEMLARLQHQQPATPAPDANAVAENHASPAK